MRALIIDDKPLSLDYFQRLLREQPGVELAGKFTDPHKALAAAGEVQPDVVFLDIEMPEISGIELAKAIQQRAPQAKIVFVTAYREYAVQAFELNATDYLLKPIRKDRLEKALERLRLDQTQNTAPPKPQDRIGQVCCFSSLQFRLEGSGKLIEAKWRTARTKELFALLLHHRRKPIRKDYILELIWPDTDPAKSVAQLYSTIYQIRKLADKIGLPLAIHNQANSYIMELQGIPIDAENWESDLLALSPLSQATLNQHLEVLDRYSGDYLGEEDYLWAEGERERLRALWLHQASAIGAFLKDNGQPTAALALYRTIQERHPYMEDTHFMLMQLYASLGARNKVTACYEKLVKMVREEYETEPSAQIQTWYEAWQRQTIRS